MLIHTICVCGAGTMGSGIAQVAAQSGADTILYELNPAVLSKAKLSVQKSLLTLVEKGKLDEIGRQDILGRLHFTSDINHCKADVFIEAIIEKPEAKISLFRHLSSLNKPDAIFASNTSSLAINAIAREVKNPERVIGMHFFNPAPVMKLVEVVTTPYTNEKTAGAIVDLAKQMGKTPVTCEDSPGFIVNRVARPYYIEALRLVEEGIGAFETIDNLMEATGFKMGPFKLMDLIGNDINYAVSCSVYQQLGEPPRLKPSLIQKEKVEKAELGKKTSKGYYDYPSPPGQ